MRCSGSNFTELAKKMMPEKLVLRATGSSFTFSLQAEARTKRWFEVIAFLI
jgi:hypothetical protein